MDNPAKDELCELSTTNLHLSIVDSENMSRMDDELNTVKSSDKISLRDASANSAPFYSHDALTLSTHQGDNEKVCCVCSTSQTKYRCPVCNRHTCSLDCVRKHKRCFDCTGLASAWKPLSLQDYTSAQLQRDFYFLEDCRRVVSNSVRFFNTHSLPRYNFHTLPSNLRALRAEAGRRGVVCQIMSEGLTKRSNNTSRYDRRNDTITWHCEFVFHYTSDIENKDEGESFTVTTDWANERHKLGDIVRCCWATNPPLPCFRINRTYNRFTKHADGSDALKPPAQEGQDGKYAVLTRDEFAVLLSHKEADSYVEEEGALESVHIDLTASESPVHFLKDTLHVSDTPPMQVRGEHSHPSGTPYADMTQLHEEVPGEREKVEGFLGAASWAILAKAERLGNETKFFYLNPDDTLNAALRELFFINEYPVFHIVRKAVLSKYPAVSVTDKQVLRESFRTREEKVTSRDGGSGATGGGSVAVTNKIRSGWSPRCRGGLRDRRRRRGQPNEGWRPHSGSLDPLGHGRFVHKRSRNEHWDSPV